MSFPLPAFDELLNALLTDYANQFPEADLSQGSLTFIKSACYSSALWSLYQYQQWISRQILPDTADSEYMERHAFVRGLERRAGETDAALLARLLDYIRRPPAGGNKYDCVKWALEVDGVQSAICIPTGQGPGTVDVVILAAGAAQPSQALLAAVYAHIVDLHPAASLLTRVLAPEIVVQDITMTVNAEGVNPAAVAVEITAFMNSLALGQSLYIAQLISLALGTNYGDVTVTLPAANVVATNYQKIAPGVISVA
ncbi:MAG: hypothetical protein EG824_01975 [Deltaproteobacteria bacterium]|nr:hypothetical protein [Deltaproteobacteria bacterium]